MKNRITVFIVCTVVFIQNCTVTNKIATAESPHLGTRTLAAYGEKIYKRENCGSCHTLQIEIKNTQPISLDGVGGNFPDSWLYHYLLDPKAIMPQSKKTAYSDLFQNKLNKNVLSKIAEEQGLKKNTEKLWENLLRQARSLSGELAKEGITSQNDVEVLALISFIQQIPSSDKKLKLDSLEQIKQMEEQKKWDNLISDSMGIISEVANDKTNGRKGKQLFEAYCSACHGRAGQGGIAPNLTDDYWLHGSKKSEIARTIIYGIPGKGMNSWKNQLTPTQVGELISFISSIRGTNPKNAKEPQGKKE